MRSREIILILLFTSCLTACKTRRNVVVNEKVSGRIERVELRKDTSRVISMVSADVDTEKNEKKVIRREITSYDTLGRVREVVREDIEQITGERCVSKGKEQTVAVSGTESTIETKVDSVKESSFTDKTTTDTRTVQGVEWFWVILSVGLIMAMAIIVLIKKLK